MRQRRDLQIPYLGCIEHMSCLFVATYWVIFWKEEYPMQFFGALVLISYGFLVSRGASNHVLKASPFFH